MENYLNDSRFRSNGASGYVLKPPCLLSSEGFDALTVDSNSPHADPTVLTIRVSGRFVFDSNKLQAIFLTFKTFLSLTIALTTPSKDRDAHDVASFCIIFILCRASA